MLSDRRTKKNIRVNHVVCDVRKAGIATLWTVLSVILLFAFVALAVDVVYVTVAGRQLSAGADAASLAAVAQVRRDRSAARDKALELAAANSVNTSPIQVRRNDANSATGNIVIGVYRRADATFTPLGLGEGLPNAVRVTASRTEGSLGGPMPTLFASLWGVNEVGVERFAIAMVQGDVGPGVIALDPSAQCSMDMRGTSGMFTINNGVLQVNSDNAQAACHAGQPSMEVEEVYVVGGTDNKFEDQVDLSGELIGDADPIPDPLASLPEPLPPTSPSADFTDLPKITDGTHVLQPGLYDDLEINGGNVTMQPGLYYITGEAKITGGDVDATAGVMLFLGPTGNLDVSGNGAFRISGMSPTVYPEGPTVPAGVANIQVPIFQSRQNTQEADINGTPNWQIDGTIYVPNGSVTVKGTPGTFANGLIAGSIQTRGNADLIIDFEGQFPRLPRKVFLVE